MSQPSGPATVHADALVEFLRGLPPTRHINFVAQSVSPVGCRYGLCYETIEPVNTVNQMVADYLLCEANQGLLAKMTTEGVVYVTVAEVSGVGFIYICLPYVKTGPSATGSQQ